LGTEITFGDGECLDRYLANGDKAWLDRVGTFGHRSVSSRRLEGMLAESYAGFPAAAFRTETVRVLDGLRAHPPHAGRWRHFGLDVDYDPVAAKEQLGQLMDSAGREHMATTLETSRRYDEAARAARRCQDLREPMAWREQQMSLHAIHAIQMMPPDTRAVLCGHNLHVGPGSAHIDTPDGVGPDGGIRAPLGRTLADRDPGQIACIWTLHDHGVDSGPPPTGGPFRSTPRSLNAAFAGVGWVFAIPTRTVQAMRRPWKIAMCGTTIHGVPADLCDLILFTAEATPLHQ